MEMEGVLDRYSKLGVEDSLRRSYNYPSACTELAFLVKLTYSNFPKFLQSIAFQDVLTAFRLLPRMQTKGAVLAANSLVQAVESALPKHKRAVAAIEFKHAMVAHKRLSKALYCQQDLVELPQDPLVHVFTFLDLRSLISVSQVCRSWNAASNDNRLWQLMYTMFFNAIHNFSKINKLYGGLTEDEKSERSLESIASSSSNLDWRSIFKKTYNGYSSTKLLSSPRGFCRHCQAFVWVSDIGNETSGLKCKYHQIKPISKRQILDYIDGGCVSSDSDSDSELYDESVYKLWAFPKRGEFSS